MKNFTITPVSQTLRDDLQKKIDSKTKPLGALGFLEEIALRIGLIQDSLTLQLTNPTIVVFAADHGIAKEGVSAYPQEVTYQMVLNFLNGGAAINVFCRQNNIGIKVVDAGVNHEFPNDSDLINLKIDYGTKSFLKEKAMTSQQCETAIERGAALIDQIHNSGCNIIGFGEMGIGNTSSASILMSLLCDIPIEKCAGRGTGLSNNQFKQKVQTLKKAIDFHNIDNADPFNALVTFGGFEIAMMCGAMLKAAELKMTILVDGFISTSSFLVAHQLYPHIIDYALFSHQSDEYAHAMMLQFLESRPLLGLNLRLGEGTGAAIAFPVIQSAVNFLNNMASFESAGVSTKE